jgi:protein-L-isoaspartate(D-aspartate) O-methyltransferase
MLDLDHARRRMVDFHVARRGVRDERVLQAMRTVPRENFVERGFEEFAYEDAPLPIAEGQTISQPYIVARMIEAAELEPADRVLEVGTGSGYAAAVMSLLVERVFSIERHDKLAETARRRMRAGGYTNVEIRTGDGTRGWPEAAPFGAILVAAGGPKIPEALKQQLDVGGRLIIPVGDRPGSQRLMRITRTGSRKFDEEDLGGVMFVPLVGEQGWADETGATAARVLKGRSLPHMIAAAAEELPPFEDPAFGAMFDRFGDRRIVLLGEASHGTAEFYRARAAITRRLIEKFNFRIVAVEADWPDAAKIDREVRVRPRLMAGEPPFRRFPTWMWRNTDVLAFLHWLRNWNEAVRAPSERTGFYGLDIYNMSDSIATVLHYLDKVDPKSAAVARQRYGCLTPWQNEPSTYGRAVLTQNYRKCEEEVVAQCRDLLRKQLEYSVRDGDDLLDATQSAQLIASAEKYYRIMYYGGAESWNLRDRHMFTTLEHVLAANGSDAKAVVWAHNSHIGDARHTEMGQVRDELNIGQLCRERFGDEVALIGFGTHQGTVACATDWGGPMKLKHVTPSHIESSERIFHEVGKPRFLLDMPHGASWREPLGKPRLQRFIGVIYRPETELTSHYAEASLSRQFDAYVWFDETTAVTPLPAVAEPASVPDTYPFGL